jgi:hypothetical protein
MNRNLAPYPGRGKDEMTLDGVTPRRHQKWGLLIDALVEVHRNGQLVRTGFVEDAMADSSILWLAADGQNQRQMFEASRGYQVWVAPQSLTGSLRYRMTAQQIFDTKPNTSL